MTRVGAVLLTVMALLLAPALAFAQDGEGEEEEVDAEAAAFLAGEEGDGGGEEGAAEGGDAEGGEGDEGDGELDDDAAAFLAGDEEEPLIEGPAEEEGIGRDEPADMRFHMVGMRWRMLMVPDWLLGAFFNLIDDDNRPSSVTINHALGLEYTTRKNRLSIIASIWWAGYVSDSGGSQFLNEGEFIAEESGSSDDPEVVSTDFHLLMFTVDFVHSYMFVDWFGITYGAGLGLGVRLSGALHQHEAYNDTSEGEYRPCTTSTDGPECQDADDNWNSEDTVWPIYPWINVLLGLRFKPMRHLEINIDGGVGLGFLFGARVSYIF